MFRYITVVGVQPFQNDHMIHNVYYTCNSQILLKKSSQSRCLCCLWRLIKVWKEVMRDQQVAQSKASYTNSHLGIISVQLVGVTHQVGAYFCFDVLFPVPFHSCLAQGIHKPCDSCQNNNHGSGTVKMLLHIFYSDDFCMDGTSIFLLFCNFKILK